MLPRIRKADFYKLKILFGGGENRDAEHAIYLEEGEYTIELDPKNIESYPVIKTQSLLQNGLTSFYSLTGQDPLQLENFIKKHPGSLVSAYF